MDDDVVTGKIPKVKSFRLIRLKTPILAAGELVDATAFIDDLACDPLLGQAQIPGAALSIFGHTSDSRKPSYAEFLEQLGITVPGTTSCAYVVVIRSDDAGIAWYAMPFGTAGRYILRSDLLDVDGARETSLQLTVSDDPMNVPKIQQLGTTILGSRPMRVAKKATGDASFGDFDFARSYEFLDDINAKPVDRAKFGSSVRGGIGVGLTKSLSLDGLAAQVVDLEDTFTAAQATPAHDAMHAVRDSGTIAELDELLVQALRSGKGDVKFTTPDFIEDEQDVVFQVTQLGRSHSGPHTEFDIERYRELLLDADRMQIVDLDYLKAARVSVGSDEPYKKYAMYNCLSASFGLDNKTYVHHDRNWYEIPVDVLADIDDQVDSIELWTALAHQPKRIDEPAFIELQDKKSFILMDRRLEVPFAGQTRIEICDLLTIDTDLLTLVHVKRDFNSSTLSHLFNQGSASALMLLESDPRKRFADRIAKTLSTQRPKPPWHPKAIKFLGPDFRPARTRVVYAIIGSWQGKKTSQRLPFMSKLNLARAARELRGRQFEVALAAIDMPSRQP